MVPIKMFTEMDELVEYLTMPKSPNEPSSIPDEDDREVPVEDIEEDEDEDEEEIVEPEVDDEE